jgi:GNAT superfamily N-acetyltransferase
MRSAAERWQASVAVPNPRIRSRRIRTPDLNRDGSMHTRHATPDDADTLAALLRDYLAERHPDHPGCTAETLRHDVLSGEAGQRVILAERGGLAIGFVAWDRTYDMHWAAKGVQIADLYVEPGSRGHGVALAMLAAVCADGMAEDAIFLRGAAYDRTSATGRFYERIAIGRDSAECQCAGRAFRRLAELDGKPVRTIIRNLPPPEWNFEA